MRRITIDYIRFKNFKGIESLKLEFKNENCTINGTNETGKTTIFDGFLWLLFGKDSTGRKDFQIKPTDEDGNDIHNLDTEIEAGLIIDGASLVLTKTFFEKWTQKRGSNTKSFTGHTTKYFLDEVPTSEREYNDRIKSIIEPATFRMLTDPFEFNNIKWPERRKILTGLCGKYGFQDIVDSDGSLSGLPGIIGEASIDDHKKKIAAKCVKINDELKQIPVRIDELTAANAENVQPNLKDRMLFASQIKDQREKLTSLTSGTAISEKTIEINEIDSEILKVKNAAPDINALKKPILDNIAKLESEIRVNGNKLIELENSIKTEESRLSISESAREEMLAKWYAEDKKEFAIQEECPTCGQDIPEDQKKEAEKKFNLAKADRLTAITNDGKKQAAAIESRKKTISDINANKEKITKTIEATNSKITLKNTELNAIVSKVDIDKITSLEKKKRAIKMDIDAIRNGSRVQEENIKLVIEDLEKKIAVISEQEASVKAAETSKKRIEELGAKEKSLSAEYEQLQYELSLIEKYIVTEVNLIEKDINDKFEMAKFKLFDVQINGGIKEMCRTTHNGVQFNRGLNNAARINVGLDIIKTLSSHYGVSAPVFIDNAESVVEVNDIGCQMIKLVVDKDCEKITQSRR